MGVNQYDIFWIDLNPSKGHEIKKTRPCVVISPDEMNQNISTVIIAPVTSRSKNYPTRVKINFKNKTGYIVLDQIRTIDITRLKKRDGLLNNNEIFKVKKIIKEMLVD